MDWFLYDNGPRHERVKRDWYFNPFLLISFQANVPFLLQLLKTKENLAFRVYKMTRNELMFSFNTPWSFHEEDMI